MSRPLPGTITEFVGPAALPRWSVVIPYYNERDYLPETLSSMAAQDFREFRLVLVDNGSTDGGEDICRTMMRQHPDIETIYLREPRPGKIHALETGLANVETEFIAFCDADTYYPPHYLGLCAELLDHAPPRIVGAMAIDIYASPDSFWSTVRRYYHWVISHILAKQAHTGGFGQTFRTAAIKSVGGYSARYWRHVLEDHEIMHRIFKIGAAPHHRHLWCVPSQRRMDRVSVRWTLSERLLYHFVPFAAKDWFFYRFLDRRFAKRQLSYLNLRERTWANPEPPRISNRGIMG